MLTNFGLENAGLWSYKGFRSMNAAVEFPKELWKTVLLVSGSPMALHSLEDVDTSILYNWYGAPDDL